MMVGGTVLCVVPLHSKLTVHASVTSGFMPAVSETHTTCDVIRAPRSDNERNARSLIFSRVRVCLFFNHKTNVDDHLVVLALPTTWNRPTNNKAL